LSDDGRIVGTTDTQYTSLNIDAAVSRGLEFEFRKKLPYSFTFGGNYSLIESDVTISADRAGQLTSLERPLQGQSPELLNLQLDFEPERWQATFTLLYNVIGRRITGVGADGRPDEYRESLTTLDLVASKAFKDNWKIKAQAKNILDPEVRQTQGDKVTRVSKRGPEYSIGVSGTF
ncbi:MAG: TonB-dependent receptor, partial [Bdellovibrionales bacterium]|nr:TonB-dependent receptor [Bdellovibrionales bacterium]